MGKPQDVPAAAIVEHIRKMLHDPEVPALPPELADMPELQDIHAYILELRQALAAFVRGEPSMDLHMRGIVAGKIKSLQANLLHLTWQIQRVAAGDFTQRVDFLGEFSTAFNSMVRQLDDAVTSLRHKEEELTRLTGALQDEIAQKAAALAALRKSEASFRYMAEHDALTGVLNRRSFFDMAVMELARAQQVGYYCSLAIFDIDKFKSFNDTYGHIEGDAALRHVTEVTKAGLRQDDIMARYGGEEFVVLSPLADKDVGRNVAERLRAAVARSPVRTKAGDVGVTVSVGLANIPPTEGGIRDVHFLEEVLRHADDALYAAKNSGRNCLVVSAYPGQGNSPAAKGDISRE